MKMIAILIAATLAGVVLADVPAPVKASTSAQQREETRKRYEKLTPEEQEKLWQERVARHGGLVERPGSGEIPLFDAQTALAEHQLKEMFMLSSQCPIKIPFRYRRLDGAFSLASIPAVLEKTGVRGAVFIVDDSSLPMTLCAMEAGWGVVNVAPLKTDSPKRQLLFQRVNKLFTRVATVAFGGCNQTVGFSAMQSVNSLKDLDEMGAFAIAPQGLTMISDHLPRLGVTFPYTTTYKRAVREGWAPMPTNEVQRAIVEKFRADRDRGPTSPILIPPDKK